MWKLNHWIIDICNLLDLSSIFLKALCLPHIELFFYDPVPDLPRNDQYWNNVTPTSIHTKGVQILSITKCLSKRFLKFSWNPVRFTFFKRSILQFNKIHFLWWCLGYILRSYLINFTSYIISYVIISQVT